MFREFCPLSLSMHDETRACASCFAERFILLVLATAVLASTLWGLLRARSHDRAAAPISPSRLLTLDERNRDAGR